MNGVNTVEQRKVNRLNTLFEKMVSENANLRERQELNHLYQEYINDGRTPAAKKSLDNSLKRIALG
ncbi:hypothetical protein [Thalassotalea sp. G2M2-11]|uniref:hypothetical protein n=1 Tax=Thalassotalea sp. G2M2-11 TaxID=2787627 RepID=UPI0019D0319D|nr:hypothetical protein [Thalassotalea sp. G2M2-11]